MFLMSKLHRNELTAKVTRSPLRVLTEQTDQFNAFRNPVGTCRIACEIEDAENEAVILKVRHRRDVYG